MIWDTASWVTEMGILSVRMPKGDMIWDTASHPDVSEDMKRCALVPLHIERGYQSAAFSKDGKILALGGSDIRLLASPSGELIRTITLPELSMEETHIPLPVSDMMKETLTKKLPVAVWALAWRPDGRQLAAGCVDGSVRLLPIENYSRLP